MAKTIERTCFGEPKGGKGRNAPAMVILHHVDDPATEGGCGDALRHDCRVRPRLPNKTLGGEAKSQTGDFWFALILIRQNTVLF